MDTKYQRYADRLRELIEEGKHVATLERPGITSPYIQDKVQLRSWLVKVENMIRTVFGSEGAHFQQYRFLMDHEPWAEHARDIEKLIGLLTGALDDLENGYLVGQEFIVAGQVFDSVLEQARYLNQNGYKDPAAVLARVVLEDTLRRIARSQGLDDTQRASQINDALRQAGRYPLPQWRLVQHWLDIGNAAAHGNFDEYTQEDVERLLDDTERFLATELRGP